MNCADIDRKGMAVTASSMRGLRRQRGLSIVELMISLTIGALLIAGMTQVFMGTREGYQLQTSMSRVQENARFAHHYLARELRQADSFGCVREGRVHSILETDDTNDEIFGFGDKPGFLAYADVNELPDQLSVPDNDPTPLANSEVLLIRGQAAGELALSTDKQSDFGSAQFFIENSAQAQALEEDRIISVSDCEVSVVAQITGLTYQNGTVNVRINPGAGNPGNTNEGLDALVEDREMVDGASISLPTTRVYYLAENPVGEPALYRTVDGGAPEELVTGIERMQLEYGIDTTGNRNVNRYEPVASVPSWDNVITTRLSLLVRDERENMRDEPQEIVFMGDNICGEIDCADRRLRHVVNSTVTLRNRAH